MPLDRETWKEFEELLTQRRNHIINLRDSAGGSPSTEAEFTHKEKPGTFPNAKLYDMYHATELELKQIINEVRAKGGDTTSENTLVGELARIQKFMETVFSKYIKKQGWADLTFTDQVLKLLSEHPRAARIPREKLPLA